MATDKPITGFDPLDVADVEQDDILVVVDVHDTDQSSSGSTKTLTLAALFGSMVDAVLSGILTFTAAVSKIIPGATSFSIRNHADSADNLLVSDAGAATARASLAAPHLLGTGSAPSVTTAIAGASVSVVGTDARGIVTLTLGGGGFTGPGNIFTLTFNVPFAANPVPIVIPATGQTVYIPSGPTTNLFSCACKDNMSASLTTFYYYHVIG